MRNGRYARRDGRRPAAHRATSSAKPAFVIGGDGKPHFVNKIFPTGTKAVFRLRTKAGGYEVDLTADHQVWTENRGDVPASELRAGDHIALSGSGFGRVALEEHLAFAVGTAIGEGDEIEPPFSQTLPRNQRREASLALGGSFGALLAHYDAP